MSDIRDRFDRLVRTARSKGATCDLNPPADPALLQNALALLGEGGAAYGEFLALADGAQIAGLELFGCQMMNEYDDGVSFLSWGNGDVDCISKGTRYPAGVIYFCNHSPDVTCPVADSLADWLDRVAQEISTHGDVWHLYDYADNPGVDRRGVYRVAFDTLKNTDSEIANYVRSRRRK